MASTKAHLPSVVKAYRFPTLSVPCLFQIHLQPNAADLGRLVGIKSLSDRVPTGSLTPRAWGLSPVAWNLHGGLSIAMWAYGCFEKTGRLDSLSSREGGPGFE